jgi:hypothetical protein
VQRDTLQSIYAAPEGEAKVSRAEAVEKARQEALGQAGLKVRQAALGPYSADEPSDDVRGRLVWAVSFEPDLLAPVAPSGPPERDRSCDWAFHYGSIVVAIDAESGAFLWSQASAYFDPSLPPTYNAPNHSDRNYCEHLKTEWQAAARDLD